MNKEFLGRLYWACTAEDSVDAVGTRLSELYERIEDVEKAERLFSKKLYDLDLPDEKKHLLDNLNGSVAMAYEMQGFMNGFRLGMKLAGELRGEGRA